MKTEQKSTGNDKVVTADAPASTKNDDSRHSLFYLYYYCWYYYYCYGCCCCCYYYYYYYYYYVDIYTLYTIYPTYSINSTGYNIFIFFFLFNKLIKNHKVYVLTRRFRICASIVVASLFLNSTKLHVSCSSFVTSVVVILVLLYRVLLHTSVMVMYKCFSLLVAISQTLNIHLFLLFIEKMLRSQLLNVMHGFRILISTYWFFFFFYKTFNLRSNTYIQFWHGRFVGLVNGETFNFFLLQCIFLFNESKFRYSKFHYFVSVHGRLRHVEKSVRKKRSLDFFSISY